MQGTIESRPGVWLVGEVEHPDFAEAVALLRATANLGPGLPEVIILAQSRPGVIGPREIERLRRSAPLAGAVSLLGSWCEGETRTGRPAAGVGRLYWYEFPSWWRRQLALREAGRCPEWARGVDCRLMIDDCRLGEPGNLIVVETNRDDTAAALADVLKSAGGESVWWKPGREQVEIRGVTAGIWEGGQLNDVELERLTAFCARLAEFEAPVVALLDFPRRDRCDAARQAGTAAVLGKPWLNADLVATLRHVVGRAKSSCISPSPCVA